MHSTELVFEYDSPDKATIVANAIGQEIGEIDGDRAVATLFQDARQLSIEIDADDLVALRAGLNTWATLAEVAETTLEAGSDDLIQT